TSTAPNAKTWADLWAAYKASKGGAAPNWTDPATWPANALAPNQNLFYVAGARASLANLAKAGIAGAQADYDWLAPQLTKAAFAAAGASSGYKIAFSPT